MTDEVKPVVVDAPVAADPAPAKPTHIRNHLTVGQRIADIEKVLEKDLKDFGQDVENFFEGDSAEHKQSVPVPSAVVAPADPVVVAPSSPTPVADPAPVVAEPVAPDAPVNPPADPATPVVDPATGEVPTAPVSGL